MAKKITAILLALALTVSIYFLLSGDIDKIHRLADALESLIGLFKVILPLLEQLLA